MREFNIKNVAGFELIKEFSKRVVADEYDSFVANNSNLNQEDKVDVISENSEYFNNWLNDEADRLYEEIMINVNRYIEFGGIDSPEL